MRVLRGVVYTALFHHKMVAKTEQKQDLTKLDKQKHQTDCSAWTVKVING